jgi:hypothetical protein
VKSVAQSESTIGLTVTDMKFIILSATIWAASFNCLSAPVVDSDDRNKQCESKAREIFRQVWGDGILEDPIDRNYVSASYKSHFNARLNKCFYLLSTTTVSRTNQRNFALISETLTDLGESRVFANFRGGYKLFTYCNVDDEPCSSQAEFEKLIKHYMEE